MSEIISSPLIFSQQEVRDRFQLHQFIHKLFTPCKTGRGDLHGLTAEELYHMYKIQYPMTVLNTAIVSNMLLTGGFVDEENPEMSVLYAKIDESYFMGLKKEAQLCLLPFIKDPLAIRFRQILIGIKVVNHNDGSVSSSPEFTIKAFIELWTLNRHNASTYLTNFNANNRSSATDVYNYYRILCCIYKWPMADKIIFAEVLGKLGFRTTKGRVYGKAGMRYYPGLFIPQTIEDRVLSIEVNMCCIYNGNTHWTCEGILENMIEAQRAELCAKNLERMGFDEQERKTFEEEKAKIDFRRTFETGEVPLGQAASLKKAKNNMGYNGGLEPESEKIKVEAVPVESEDPISRTSGFNGTKDRTSANEPQDRSPVDFYEPLDIGETYRDRYTQLCEDDGYESDDEGIREDSVDSDGPSIEEIASALLVPYKMTTGEFTYEVMADWLQKMSIPDPEGVLEHYGAIMEILLNS